LLEELIYTLLMFIPTLLFIIIPGLFILKLILAIIQKVFKFDIYEHFDYEDSENDVNAKLTKKNWKYHAATAVCCAGIILLLGAQFWIDDKGLHDFCSILGLMMCFISGCYVTIFEEELNK